MSERNYDKLDQPRDETDYLAISAQFAQQDLEQAQAADPDAAHENLVAARDERVNNLANAAVSIIERAEQIGQPRIELSTPRHEAISIPVQRVASAAENIRVNVLTQVR